MKPADPTLVLSLALPVAWAEQDLFGHLNNTVYFRYMENIRMHLLERIGVLGENLATPYGVILASTECQFLRPVQWPDTITIFAGVTAIGRTSFTMRYELYARDGARVAEGSSVQVMYDYASKHKVEVPDAVRERIADLAHEHIPQ